MSRIGIIYTAYQAEDLVESSIIPWINARAAKLGGHEFVIAAVSVPFEGFIQDKECDRTRAILGGHTQADDIDHVIVTDKPLTEIDARGAALRWLVSKAKVDLTWQVDADEIYTEGDIRAALAFVEANPFVDWFRVCLKNYVFTDATYMAEPFTPPRIHRTQVGGAGVGNAYANGFWDDNNVLYNRGMLRDFVRDTELASMTIPKEQLWVPHMTWLNNERSRRKQAYQTSRGWNCSFSWDDTQGGLVWNADHFKQLGQFHPQLVCDQSGPTLAQCSRMFPSKLPMVSFSGISKKSFT